MIEVPLDAGLSSVERYGPVILFVAFVFEGAIVGKVIPTRTLFVGALLLVSGTIIDYLTTYLVAVLGATIGQVGLFTLLRHYDLRFEQLRVVPVNDRHVERAERWFNAYGLPAVAISNVLPVMRGTMTVPVAMSSASVVWFTLASGIGTVVYLGILVALALGIDDLFL